MYLNNKKTSIAYKVLFIVICALGLLLTTGVFNGNINLEQFNYYTILSNILCLIYFIGALIANLKSTEIKTFLPRFKGAVVMSISVTGLIYHFILLPTMFKMDNQEYNVLSLHNIIIHYLVPIMTVLDWLIFDKKGVYHKLDPLTWIVIPYIYFAFALIRAQISGVLGASQSRYPYGFIDLDLLGVSGVLTNVVGLTVAFVVLGYIIYAIDKLMASIMLKT